MESPLIYLMLADALLVLHVLIVIFIVAGLAAIYAGKAFAWSWVCNPWFRVLHVAAITIVVLQSWMGIICPLTNWEMWLRGQSGDTVYSGSFIAHWLAELLYYEMPSWVFTVAYSVFGILVIASWFFIRPRPFANSSKTRSADKTSSDK